MSLSSLRTRARAFFGFRSLAIGILLCAAAAFADPPPRAIGVNIDQARLIKLPARVATIVIGNPLIADVTLQPGGIVVVTGKGYGATNFIAMDRAGEVLVDRLAQRPGQRQRSGGQQARELTGSAGGRKQATDAIPSLAFRESRPPRRR